MNKTEANLAAAELRGYKTRIGKTPTAQFVQVLKGGYLWRTFDIFADTPQGKADLLKTVKALGEKHGISIVRCGSVWSWEQDRDGRERGGKAYDTYEEAVASAVLAVKEG